MTRAELLDALVGYPNDIEIAVAHEALNDIAYRVDGLRIEEASGGPVLVMDWSPHEHFDFRGPANA